VAPLKRREFVGHLQDKMSRVRGSEPILSDAVRQELGTLLIYILKEVLTVDNKYGYKVPLLISEHRSIKKKN
jgi:hypothetical protein